MIKNVKISVALQLALRLSADCFAALSSYYLIYGSSCSSWLRRGLALDKDLLPRVPLHFLPRLLSAALSKLPSPFI